MFSRVCQVPICFIVWSYWSPLACCVYRALGLDKNRVNYTRTCEHYTPNGWGTFESYTRNECVLGSHHIRLTILPEEEVLLDVMSKLRIFHGEFCQKYSTSSPLVSSVVSNV
jgi:hypothetical protein